MTISMSRIFFILLLLFAFILCFVCGQASKRRFLRCKENVEKVSIAYFAKAYVNKLYWNAESPLPENGTLVEELLSVCLCRDNFDPLFFMMPYANSTGDDMVVVCVYGENFSSIGVFDDEELYDLLMVKYQELIPASVIDPVPLSQNVTHSECYDIDHFPTKDVMGQKTCLFSAYADSSTINIYSGPLMSLPLLNQSWDGIPKYCYSGVENSTNTLNDSCFFEHSYKKSSLACCCTENPELCSIPQKLDNYYYCFVGELSNSYSSPAYSFSVQKYFNEFYKPACTATIYAYFKGDENDDVVVDVLYGATNSCQNIDRKKFNIYSYTTKFCSGNQISTKYTTFKMKKCCDNKNFCNFDLIPPELSYDEREKSKKCGTLDAPALYASLFILCGAYYDLTQIKEENYYLGQKKNLYDGFNAEFILGENTKNGMNYGIAKIIKADNETCDDIIIKDKDVNYYFPIYNCGDKECQNPPIFSFKCEQSNAQNAKISNSSWFCYVKIIPKQKDEFDVKAGFLEIKEYSPCYKQNIFRDTYCCVNIFNQIQIDTGCTMESMTLVYQKHLQAQKNASNELPDSEKSFTECLQRDIGPEQKCPGNDGCFEIRSLTESDESEVVEPAGCLGLAENYVLDNLDMTNLALGCRADLNSNRCSMVQSPSGEQRIVCCCNHPDENGECKTEADQLPQKVGKPVSTFKTIEL